MRGAGLCVCLIALSACAETPSAPVEWDMAANRSFDTKAIFADAFVAGCGGEPIYTHETTYSRGCTIMIGQTKFIGLAYTYVPGLGQPFTGLRTPGQLSFVVDSDTIPAPPSPGPFRSAWVRGDAALSALLAQAGFVESDTIPAPPSPFLLANATSGRAMMVLSVDELARKRIIGVRPNGTALEVLWTVRDRGLTTNYVMNAALPPSDTIPGRRIDDDCELSAEGCVA